MDGYFRKLQVALGSRSQSGARIQRRAKDSRPCHYRECYSLRRMIPAFEIPGWVLMGFVHGDRARNLKRRLAHRPDHGHAAGRGFKPRQPDSAQKPGQRAPFCWRPISASRLDDSTPIAGAIRGIGSIKSPQSVRWGIAITSVGAWGDHRFAMAAIHCLAGVSGSCASPGRLSSGTPRKVVHGMKPAR